MKKTTYQNIWSKWLFKKKFENQFFIPLPVSPIESAIFRLIEQIKFSTHGLENYAIKKPIFIVGLPRSGTTLLYNLLCAHESAAFVTNSMNAFPEALESIEWMRKKFNWNVRGERFLKDSIEVDFGSPSEPLTLWGRWFKRDPISLYWEEQTLADLPKGQTDLIYTDIQKILRSFGGTQRRFIVKYPLLQTELNIVQELFPDALFVHILRDPRMAANSLVKLYQISNEQLRKIKHPMFDEVIPYPRLRNLQAYVEEFGADDVRCTSRIWRDAVELVRENSVQLKNYFEVRYEDILAQPEVELKKVFSFCDLSWPGPENSRFVSELEKVGKIHHRNEYRDFQVIKQIVDKTMQEFGYQ